MDWTWFRTFWIPDVTLAVEESTIRVIVILRLLWIQCPGWDNVTGVSTMLLVRQAQTTSDYMPRVTALVYSYIHIQTVQMNVRNIVMSTV